MKLIDPNNYFAMGGQPEMPMPEQEEVTQGMPQEGMPQEGVPEEAPVGGYTISAEDIQQLGIDPQFEGMGLAEAIQATQEYIQQNPEDEQAKQQLQALEQLAQAQGMGEVPQEGMPQGEMPQEEIPEEGQAFAYGGNLTPEQLALKKKNQTYLI